MANVTIDDADPSIIYLPDGAWNTRNPTAPCPGCGTNPNYAMMFDDTFHDGTFFPAANVPLTASMLFNGTAVYIFCALAQSSNGISDMTFFIDGVNRGTFTQPIAPGIPYQYSIPVFSIASLSPGQHTLTIQNGHVNGTKALTMLDEIIYTAVDTISPSTSAASTFSQSISSTSPISSQQSPTSNADSAKSTKKNSGIIIGPIVAVVLVVALGLGLFFWWRRRRPQSGNPRRTTRDYDTASAWMSEPLSLPSSHPAYSSASDAQASFGVAAELLPSSGRGNGPRADPTSATFYPSNGTSGIQASIDNAGTPSNLYLSPTSSQPVQQSPVSTDDTSSPLSYPSSAPQRHVEDDATLDDVPPAYDEQRRKSTRAAEDREIAAMNR